jgi:maltose alpha-D-glucosyltransferase/alpha-amylase
MQWSADRNAGFSSVDSAALYFPVVVDPPYGYQTVNVEAEERTPSSLLHFVRAIVKLRRRYRAFARGTFEPLAPENRHVLAFLRRYDDEVILCVNNVAHHAQYVELDLSEFDGWRPIELWSGNGFPKIGALPYLLTLNTRDFLWFKLEPPGGARRLDAASPVGS